VVLDEETFDAAFPCLGTPGSGRWSNSTAGNSPPIFDAAMPPRLAPGMQLALPDPDPAHRHQLKLVRIQ
jgi:hypothetical protein